MPSNTSAYQYLTREERLRAAEVTLVEIRELVFGDDAFTVSDETIIAAVEQLLRVVAAARADPDQTARQAVEARLRKLEKGRKSK